MTDSNALTLEYVAGLIDANRKKRLAKSAGLLDEVKQPATPEGDDVDLEELGALLGGDEAPAAEE